MKLSFDAVVQLLFPEEVIEHLPEDKKQILLSHKTSLEAVTQLTNDEIDKCILSIYSALGKQYYSQLLQKSSLSKQCKKMQPKACCSWCKSSYAHLSCSCKLHYYCSSYCKKSHWKTSHRTHAAHVRYRRCY